MHNTLFQIMGGTSLNTFSNIDYLGCFKFLMIINNALKTFLKN